MVLRLEVRRKSDKSDELVGAWDWYPQESPEREASHRWLAHLDPGTSRLIATQSPEQRTKALQSVLVDYLAKESDPLVSEAAYLGALRTHVPPRVYLLTADRTLRSDQVERDAVGSFGAGPRPMRPDELMAMGREHALNHAIALAARHFSQTRPSCDASWFRLDAQHLS